MDVTRENFDDLFPEIRKSIENAAFIAIDGEFTGLSTSVLHDPALFDTPEIRYTKLKKSLSSFALCQFGLSMYVPNEFDGNAYTVHTYNIFLSAPSFGLIDSKFLCQASALEFLTNHNFDFNTCFKHGVSYLSKDQEDTFWEYHKRDTIKHQISSILQRQYDEKFIDPALKEINSFLQKSEEEDYIEINSIPKGFPQYSFLKTIQSLYSNVACYVKKRGSIIVQKKSTVDSNEFEKQYEVVVAQQVAGFSSVIRLISDLKKPIIGHNMLADLIFIYKMFFHDLPPKYLKFKNEIHRLFPVVYDTKHIAYMLRREFRNVDFFEDTCLGELYDVLSSPKALYYKLYTPQIKHAEGFIKYANMNAIHEAGYDAFLTGYVFLRLAHLSASKDIHSTESKPLAFQDHLGAVYQFENCVNITRAAVRYLNFSGKEPPLNLPECFIVTSKKKSIKISADKIAQAFLPFGSVDVKMMSINEALVAVSHRSMSKDVVKAFCHHKLYYVHKYRWYHAQRWKDFAWYGGFGTLGVFLLGTTYIFYRSCQDGLD